MLLNNKQGLPQTICTAIATLEEGAALLADARIAHAAVMMDALPPQLGVSFEYVASIRELQRNIAQFDAVIADGSSFAAAAKYIASLRAKQPKQAESPISTDSVPQTFAPDPDADVPEPETPPEIGTLSPIRNHPALILMLDDLKTVPSLIDLPGAQPDAIIAAPALGESTPKQVLDAYARVIAVSADTLYAKAALPAALSGTVSDTHMLAVDSYAGRNAHPHMAAKLLLSRGREGGLLFCSGNALAHFCGITPGDAMYALMPALASKLDESAPKASPLPARPIETLTLADIPLIAREALRKAYPMQKALSEQELTTALRTLYGFRSGKIAAEELVAMQEDFFRSGRTLPVSFRLRQLKLLDNWIETHEAEIESALLQDLGKCAFEAFETEIMLVRSELKSIRRHLPLWMAERRGLASVVHFPATTRKVRNPHGRVLIMSPWNYPFLLTMDPLIGAIAGGNCVVLKPSAYAPATSRLFADMVHDLFDPAYVAVVEGGRAENQSLLEQKFDHIFFTGSVNVGKHVMKCAAEHLTPVTLELGGKSPCIVDETADIALAAKRIAWGKFVNAGQTCVAPDYVLCHPSVADEFLMEVERSIRELYGSDPVSNGELCRIVNEKHFDRLSGLIDSGDIAIGGDRSSELLKIEPTVLKNVSWDDPVMQEEIFGPIMPVMTWDGDFDDILTQIENRARPLAAYLFTSSKARKKAFLQRLRFGGGCINDVLCHLATESLPFGGVGESGMGAYHGRYSFDTFTHEKGVLVKSNRIDLPVRYAPYKNRLRLLRFLSRILP